MNEKELLSFAFMRLKEVKGADFPVSLALVSDKMLHYNKDYLSIKARRTWEGYEDATIIFLFFPFKG